jgi:hypothetical protein
MRENFGRANGNYPSRAMPYALNFFGRGSLVPR